MHCTWLRHTTLYSVFVLLLSLAFVSTTQLVSSRQNNDLSIETLNVTNINLIDDDGTKYGSIKRTNGESEFLLLGRDGSSVSISMNSSNEPTIHVYSASQNTHVKLGAYLKTGIEIFDDDTGDFIGATLSSSGSSRLEISNIHNDNGIKLLKNSNDNSLYIGNTKNKSESITLRTAGNFAEVKLAGEYYEDGILSLMLNSGDPSVILRNKNKDVFGFDAEHPRLSSE